ncbi:SDR family NAD(P)-dependent oxidoreductase [Telmatocola sphagniphila]|uniref:SDR family NAD(P)-dependent oxidoreductase n=1 Tax=Telmatocola sphagniphila TaxID=1123043 RepID=A0A8E6B3L5_9BACT|nr:SDR family oxidoreductase [Telmatocola sphagniphila]QVL30824.1 SDR family NAD(P)-dependent oxidoreductase [Telmatocola sphagniphila]
MSVKLKKLADQVIVITGASSGIGLMTAEAAAKGGAKLVLAARSGQALENIVARLGSEAIAVTCDVSDPQQVQQLAEKAIARFGRIDTWINNAGLGLYGRLDETNEDDDRKLFDINFWGVVHGSRAALPHLRKNGGALINVGSEVSESYTPLLGMYTASKHAVKGFTDALRVEVEKVDKAPVSITLIQPTAVNTPFPQHARNYLEHEPALPDPKLDPKQVAAAILSAAVKPVREKRVGTMAKISTTLATLFPAVEDRVIASQVAKLQTEDPPRNTAGALHQSSEAAGTAGHTHGVSA